VAGCVAASVVAFVAAATVVASAVVVSAVVSCEADVVLSVEDSLAASVVCLSYAMMELLEVSFVTEGSVSVDLAELLILSDIVRIIVVTISPIPSPLK
jgi:hypothetical protein